MTKFYMIITKINENNGITNRNNNKNYKKWKYKQKCEKKVLLIKKNFKFKNKLKISNLNNYEIVNQNIIKYKIEK